MNRSSRDIYNELLVSRCQRRDVAAWTQLVRLWNDRLLYYIRRLIDHEPDAHNVLQDVWLHVLRGIHALNASARFAPWVYAIARRTAMTHFRRLYARPLEVATEEIDNEHETHQDEPLNLENADLIHFGLGKLALPEREVLTLYFLEDLSVSEIGQLLEIPVGTVKSRLFKARHDLRCVLEKESQRHD